VFYFKFDNFFGPRQTADTEGMDTEAQLYINCQYSLSQQDSIHEYNCSAFVDIHQEKLQPNLHEYLKNCSFQKYIIVLGVGS
jgi:hypothetical protein